MNKYIVMIVFVIMLTACTASSQQPTPLTTPTPIPTRTPTFVPTSTATLAPSIYFIDQDLPGAEPRRFGADFFSGSFHSAPVFSPDKQHVWWAGEYGSATIWTSHFEAGLWTEPEAVTFSDNIDSYRDPFISPDGTKFYFISASPLPGSRISGKENIWMMEEGPAGWSEPQPLPESVNNLALHWTVSVADNYNLYFSANEDENTDIFLSEYVNGVYTDPIRMDAPINTEQMEITPNIAPDESYMLFTRIASRTDQPHLYITYKLETGWSEPVRVENVDYCISPIITPDRSFVIYLSSPSSFGWRDTSFIEELQP